MSADNYMIIDKHPLGGYGAEMGFASDEDQAVVTEKSLRFDTLQEARKYAESQWLEYGYSVEDGLQ